MTYHNTLAHEQPLLGEYQQKAMSQDEQIWKAIQIMGYRGVTPWQIKDWLLNYYVLDYEITSVRRSMNTLTREEKLVKTDEQRMGKKGRPETIWRLAGPVQGELL